MPTIAVDKDALFKELGRSYTTREFEDLCFDFGLELDGDAEGEELKIETPANRYDMLCFEGIAMNLKVFLGKAIVPEIKLKKPSDGKLLTVTIHKETEQIRPYFSCAVLRNITFTKERYESFIALQDKLHANLARQRSLVAIGTHDLDTLQGPFTYEALPPEEIKFAPLNQTKSMNAKEMMEFYEKDKHLSRYLPIIRSSPVYPIIYDSSRTVLSMPPIINSNHSKITLSTRNVFIDITATDKTKVEIVNHMLVSMFSQYCSEPFTVEPVKIVSSHNNETRETPDLAPRHMQAEMSYINSIIGLHQSAEQNIALLQKMGLSATLSKSNPDILDVSIPPTRADILHQCDIMEDAAIAYGFNKLPRHYSPSSSRMGAELPINKISYHVRLEASKRWIEVMPLVLCSHDENFAWLNRTDDGKTAIRTANPKSAESQLARTSLVPGLLKSLRENRHRRVPLRIFEVGDVVLKDASRDVRSRNERRFAACFYGKVSGLEAVHGLMDEVMRMLRFEHLLDPEEAQSEDDRRKQAYWIVQEDHPTYLPGHSAAIYARPTDRAAAERVGEFGILHPTVLKNFELP
ncbi:phenylalanine--tRNA ligase subunit beta, partial [Elasticomyces elasticus]